MNASPVGYQNKFLAASLSGASLKSLCQIWASNHSLQGGAQIFEFCPDCQQLCWGRWVEVGWCLWQYCISASPSALIFFFLLFTSCVGIAKLVLCFCQKKLFHRQLCRFNVSIGEDEFSILLCCYLLTYLYIYSMKIFFNTCRFT